MGSEVVVTEKLDGSLTCLHRGNVYARSMDGPSTAPWLAMVRKHHAWKCDPTHDHAIYGEDIYGVHSIQYAPVREAETFRVFGVRTRGPAGDRFLGWNAVAKVAAGHVMPLVPVVFRGSFPSVDAITEFFEAEIAKPSRIGGLDCEGFVMRDAHGFPIGDFPNAVAKYVRPNHVQTDRHWTRNWRPASICRS